MLSIHGYRVNAYRGGGYLLRMRQPVKMCLLCLLVITPWSWGRAEEKAASGAEALSGKPAQEARIFEMKVPQGFQSEAVDEAGILKWKKDSGEIYVVVGDLYAESGDEFIKTLLSAAENNKQVTEVKNLKLKGGKGLLYKDKPPEDPGRLYSWHLIAVTRNKVVSVDFTAPSKDFESFTPGFEEAVNSFKLKPSS